MINSPEERLYNCIGDIDDSLLYEAEASDITINNAIRRKRIAKYSAVGAASAVVSVGLAIIFWKVKANKAAGIA